MVELLCPPATQEPFLRNFFIRMRARWATLSRPGRELAIFGGALAFGVIALPLLIWISGQTLLGPYAHGGIFSFAGDFFLALAQGNPVFWIIALGPVAFLGFARLLWSLTRRRPA